MLGLIVITVDPLGKPQGSRVGMRNQIQDRYKESLLRIVHMKILKSESALIVGSYCDHCGNRKAPSAMWKHLGRPKMEFRLFHACIDIAVDCLRLHQGPKERMGGEGSSSHWEIRASLLS